MMIRDLDLTQPGVADARRLEVVADGLPLFGRAQLAVDATLVSALRSDGTARRRADQIDGVALMDARRRKERTHPELAGHNRRARLVVLVVEVGGKWSQELKCFVSQLARAKARGETHLMRRRAEQAWRLRWGGACAVARTVASTMLELPGARGADGDTPASQDVEQDCRFAGLAQWARGLLSGFWKRQFWLLTDFSFIRCHQKKKCEPLQIGCWAQRDKHQTSNQTQDLKSELRALTSHADILNHNRCEFVTEFWFLVWNSYKTLFFGMLKICCDLVFSRKDVGVVFNSVDFIFIRTHHNLFTLPQFLSTFPTQLWSLMSWLQFMLKNQILCARRILESTKFCWMMETLSELQVSSLTVTANFNSEGFWWKRTQLVHITNRCWKVVRRNFGFSCRIHSHCHLMKACTNQFSENIVLDVRKLHYIGFFSKMVINRHRHKSPPRSELDNSIRTNKNWVEIPQTDRTQLTLVLTKYFYHMRCQPFNACGPTKSSRMLFLKVMNSLYSGVFFT